MIWIELILFLICVGLLFAGAFVVAVVYLTKSPYPVKKSFKKEQYFFDPLNENMVEFPSLSSQPSLSLSVIIPAYNEEQRLPVMLDDCLGYLEARKKEDNSFTYEVILVDDGSADGTTRVGHSWSMKLTADVLRVLTLQQNRGKGGAVREGMMRARGKKLLFADADGATRFSDLDKLERKLAETAKNDMAIVCGSRAHLEKDSIAERTLFRTFLMKGFHGCVWLFGCKTVADTQCGFKLFTRAAALTTFRSLHIERWAFDVEILKIAEMQSIPMAEVAVEWKEVDGSKLDPISASAQMFKDLFLLWLRYQLRLWRLVPDKKD